MKHRSIDDPWGEDPPKVYPAFLGKEFPIESTQINFPPPPHCTKCGFKYNLTIPRIDQSCFCLVESKAEFFAKVALIIMVASVIFCGFLLAGWR